MERTEVLKSPDYWVAHIQVSLYNCASKFMDESGMNRTQLAEHLRVSKGYVSQLLNGGYDHKISKLVDLALKFGFAPKMEFEKLNDCIKEDVIRQIHSYEKREYLSMDLKKQVMISTNADYVQSASVEYDQVA